MMEYAQNIEGWLSNQVLKCFILDGYIFFYFLFWTDIVGSWNKIYTRLGFLYGSPSRLLNY